MNIPHIQLLPSFYAVIGTIALFAASPSYATARIALHGAELDLSAPCAQIKLAIDPTLKDGIALEENDSASATPQMSGTGPENRLSVSLPNCIKGNHVSLHLSPNTALTLHDSPHSTITITGTLSSLEGSLEESHIEIEHVQSLDLSLKGASTAIIHQLDRAAQIIENDTSSLLIDHGVLSAFSAKLNGHSQLIMQQGQIEALTLIASENTMANIMAQSGNAKLITNDQAKVTIGQVKTTLTHTGNAPLQQAAPPPPIKAATSITPNIPATTNNANNIAPVPSPDTNKPTATIITPPSPETLKTDTSAQPEIKTPTQPEQPIQSPPSTPPSPSNIPTPNASSLKIVPDSKPISAPSISSTTEPKK